MIIHNLKLPDGITAEFLRAEDEAVDDSILLYVEAHAESPADIQLAGREFAANCWTAPDMEEIEHGPLRRTLKEAVADAVALLRKYNWIG